MGINYHSLHASLITVKHPVEKMGVSMSHIDYSNSSNNHTALFMDLYTHLMGRLTLNPCDASDDKNRALLPPGVHIFKHLALLGLSG